MKRGISPAGRGRGIPMLYRIKMDIVHVRRIVEVAANGVFPEAPLPYAAFGPTHAGGGTMFARRYRLGNAFFSARQRPE